ncbi:class I SAM-dependent methyltransferase [Nocardioides bruguierae]|uniref:class I SAM-dependent methyltransferase n=1 Tax=Nocardioides bruguierae TaxID=2945102 RepID=UPI00202086AC|nr:class I SAM-dependent methyltransferase [Nocardioides bruguierae]MCL8024178.1 methyltransferase domain-containing protein [Nocardioides bruguierae]
MTQPPPTRWALAGPDASAGFGRKFGDLVAEGADVHGEARLADTLLPRGARVLDVGAGMGRVGAGLAARGHRVVAVEPDAALVVQARATFPDLDLLHADGLDLSPALLGPERPHEFDLVVLVGNVMVFLAEGTERALLARVRAHLGARGRVLVGFHLVGAPPAARRYPPEEFVADAEAAGLRVDARFGSYELHPAGTDYAVWLLSPVDAGTPGTTDVGHVH